MPDIPDEAVQAAAEVIMTAQNANDDEPERWEANHLARAALEAAAPVLAEAWGMGVLPDPPSLPLPAYVPLGVMRHNHGTDEPGWVEHDHLGGGEPHEHDPERGHQMPVGGGLWPHEKKVPDA